jgi:geranylgeranyl pyrophosphate synthase
MPSLEGASALDAWLEASRAWAEEQLERHFVPATEPAAGAAGASGAVRLGEALRYAVLGGGKRLRPALVRLVGTSLGAADELCELPAVAVELIHSYSLVHDDLPCMDDDDLRRGRPSCHVVFGEAMAVLAGDGLQAKAFELLARGEPAVAIEWTRVLATASGDAGMVGGQAVDMTLARGAPAEAVGAMHARKTAALISAAAELGAVSARAEPAQLEQARRFGLELGLLFQATDDLLDVTGDAETLGKTPGKDDRHEKATLVAALGVEGTQREAERRASQARAVAAELGWGEEHLAVGLVDRVLRRTR